MQQITKLRFFQHDSSAEKNEFCYKIHSTFFAITKIFLVVGLFLGALILIFIQNSSPEQIGIVQRIVIEKSIAIRWKHSDIYLLTPKT